MPFSMKMDDLSRVAVSLAKPNWRGTTLQRPGDKPKCRRPIRFPRLCRGAAAQSVNTYRRPSALEHSHANGKAACFRTRCVPDRLKLRLTTKTPRPKQRRANAQNLTRTCRPRAHVKACRAPNEAPGICEAMCVRGCNLSRRRARPDWCCYRQRRRLLFCCNCLLISPLLLAHLVLL